MDIEALVNAISTTPNCSVYDPVGLPLVGEGKALPSDLEQFYSLCGGMDLFRNEPYSLAIVPPSQFVLANPVIVGELVEDDISSSWYIIGDDHNGDYLTIDLSKERLGRCYDSFFDRHGIVGSCPIIATSFTDLLFRLYENRGQYWYWLRTDFLSLGDAYDV
jgi:hypothetical protein